MSRPDGQLCSHVFVPAFTTEFIKPPNRKKGALSLPPASATSLASLCFLFLQNQQSLQIRFVSEFLRSFLDTASMPKHRFRSPSSPRERSSRRHKRRKRSPGRGSESNLSRSREGSGHRASSRTRILQTLADLVDLMSTREVPSRSTSGDPEALIQGTPDDSSPVGETSAELNVFTDTLTDEQTTQGKGRGSVPENAPVSSEVTNVTFAEVPEVADSAVIEGESPSSDSLIRGLFGNPVGLPEQACWLPIILDTTKTDVRSGLKEELKKSLLTKYEPKEELAFLIPPKVNKEILPNLGATVIARDKHQVQSQLEAGASLNALASGFSELAKLEVLQASPEGKEAASKLAEGIRLLADHYYGLSRARRAFIVPSLNFLGKTASDAAGMDEYLFGNNFAEEVNAAQVIEKVANKMARKPQQPPSQKTRFPAGPRSGQQKNQPGPVEAPVEEGLSTVTAEQEIPIQIPDPALDTVRSAGRLALFIERWKELTSDPVVLEAIRGYRLPFLVSPVPRPALRQTRLSAVETVACNKEISRLILKGAVAKVEPSQDQFLSPFFLIKKASGGMRFILNLRKLNSYLLPPHFKMEDWRTVVRLMLPNFNMASIDLEDAYLLVPIHPSHRRFLRFQWGGSTFEFTALPFGLATAPYIFTKIMRPVVRALREKGFQSIVYVDDFLLLGASREECLRNVQTSLEVLSALGFLVNHAKSQLIPSVRCKYLGFIFDSIHQSIAIPPEKRKKLLKLIRGFACKSRCSIKDFASMIGSLVAVFPAVQYSPLYTKRFEREKFLALESNLMDYSKQMRLPPYLGEDFEWWLAVLSKPDQANPIRSGPFATEIFSDASLSGWGASCGKDRTHGWWSTEDKYLHINALELKAAFYALKCFASDLRNANILLRIDNTTAIAYVNKFGSVQHPLLSDIARDIWRWCEEKDLYIFASYIASVDNVIADSESRMPSVDTEWSLSPQAFNRVEEMFGPFEIDLFASLINTKNEIYVSWFPDPGSWAIDAFTLSWDHLYFYAFPPFILLSRVLRKIYDDKATGILITSSSRMEKPFPGCREVIREAFLAQAVPASALDVMLASLSAATIKQYSHPLRAWWNFCHRNQVSPFCPEIDRVLEFLIQEIRRVGSYSTFNTMRSAISLVTGGAIGSHPLIKRFAKGISVIKPPRPKYDFIWDPAPVIARLAKIFPYEPLDLSTITKKLVLLLALGSGQRVQTLAAIRVSQIYRETNRLIIKIPDRIKTSGPGRSQPLLTFARFPDRPELCILTILDHYLYRTRDLRAPECDSLLISFVRPHKAVGAQSISRWIRKELELSGVQTDLFSSHSTRHASTSLAARKGVSLNIIKRAAGWSGESQVFANFYNRPICNADEFCNAVLLQ
ncbi:PREDICTED: uncharacterized protein LOC105561098 [Vollenhovia emeryi]|uniref:uncharacterized protein LOC105561098 n=1 Tax=Vollenhovia emeryi TaxID=411798 RepID=UPI0005F49021|nr:PREDICTED: uncharacterized protein LOC105561098 [Vollenhovia emeryi]